MSLIVELPFTARPQTVIIRLAGVAYSFDLSWNVAAQLWVVDIADVATGRPLINGIPLVPGSDLLGQFRYLGIGNGGLMVVMSHHKNPNEPPTWTDLGVNGIVYFGLRS